MSSPPPSPLPPDLGSPSSGALPYLVAVVTGLLGFFGARFTATAPLQASLNDAFRSLMDELQTEHARLSARVYELESEKLQLAGDLRQTQQREQSLLELVRRAGIPIPGEGNGT